jgi:glutamate---cysteine ligase / carboxylate-amine ligase
MVMTGVGDTVGVEEEFHVVRADSGAPEPAARRLLRGASDAVPELQRSMVETDTEVHTGLSALRADLVARRRSLAAAAERLGLAVVAAGTVPGAGLRATQVYPNERYEWMAHEYRQLVDEQQVCACQVHVGVPDRDLAVRVIRRIRAWLPTLLALSTSSPLFAGLDTGYASYRTVLTSRWPTVGPPPDLESAAEYDRLVDDLVASGVITDAGMVYFDARLSAKYPTVEVRIADSCPSVDDAVLLTALARGLVETAAAEDAAGAPLPTGPHMLLRAAMWRSARSGLGGHLVDPLSRSALPARDRVRSLLAYVRWAVESRGDWDTVAELWQAVSARDTSAARQRTMLRAGRSHGDVVAALVTETLAG